MVAGDPGRARLHLALRSADFTTARRLLDEAVSVVREHPKPFFPFRGLWALLRTVEEADGDAARGETRQATGASLPSVIFPLRVAEAVVSGREGFAAEAERIFADASADYANYSRDATWAALVRRIAAPSALEDGWGNPSAWLREALVTFQTNGLEELASSCR